MGPFWLKIWFWNPPFAPGVDVRMLRTAVRSLLQTSRQSKALPASAGVRGMSSKVEETDAEFDARFEAYFNRPDIDGWELRKGMHDLSGFDRFPEVVHHKCNGRADIWPYMVQELRPTLDELGI